MKHIVWTLFMAIAVFTLAACSEKKKSENIIAQRVITVAPSGPVKMQEYADERDIQWIGRSYHVSIHRQAADSLPKVKDETGQEFIDNTVTVIVSRQDGSVFFNRKFAKSDFAQYLDGDYGRTGILEGLVFSKPDNDWLEFAASVSHPQTDEYIPLVVRLSRMGELVIRRDSRMDTGSQMEEEVAD